MASISLTYINTKRLLRSQTFLLSYVILEAFIYLLISILQPLTKHHTQLWGMIEMTIMSANAYWR